jgi:Fe-S-cluster containining protein
MVVILRGTNTDIAVSPPSLADRESARRISRFACTQCGACCNRSPEIELSEAAALADVFVFRLMFRIYVLPRAFEQYAGGSGEQFYQTKRLLNAFAAHNYRSRVRVGGKAVQYNKYLVISALTLDTGTGACSALADGRCSIYERRPLTCRTVPFGYSRAEAWAESDLSAFVETPGYRCDTTADAPIVLDAGRIADEQLRKARADALALAEQDRRWTKEIVRRMRHGCSTLPALDEIEANAAFGATTTSMSIAWQIAAELGVITTDDYRSLIEVQAATIERELAASTAIVSARETLAEMRAEYRRLLEAR